MILPKQFVLHGHVIKVREIDIDPEERYGYYDSVKEEIVIAKRMKRDGEIVSLTPIQVESTFWHELFHAFQWHIKGETDEWEAQSYAGLMIELIQTGGLTIGLKQPINRIEEQYDE